MRLTSSASVGIGESSPDRLFHVKGQTPLVQLQNLKIVQVKFI